MLPKNSMAHRSIPDAIKIAKIVATAKRSTHRAMIFTSRTHVPLSNKYRPALTDRHSPYRL